MTTSRNWGQEEESPAFCPMPGLSSPRLQPNTRRLEHYAFLESFQGLASHCRIDMKIGYADYRAHFLQQKENDAVMDQGAPVSKPMVGVWDDAIAPMMAAILFPSSEQSQHAGWISQITVYRV